MNIQEFKAWFAGFTEGFSGVPSDAQWRRVSEEISTLTAVSAPLNNPFTPNLINPGTHLVEPRLWQACDPVRLTAAAVVPSQVEPYHRIVG